VLKRSHYRAKRDGWLSDRTSHNVDFGAIHEEQIVEETMREWIDKLYGTIEVHYAPPMDTLELYLYLPQLRHGAFEFIGRIDIFALTGKPALLEASEKVCIIHRAMLIMISTRNHGVKAHTTQTA
jgi:hypothetical protein